jgi:hypothetical protein
LGNPQITTIMTKIKPKFKIQTSNVQWSIPILNASFIQNNVITYPLKKDFVGNAHAIQILTYYDINIMCVLLL